MGNEVTNSVVLDVTAKNSVAGGMAEAKSTVKKSLEEIANDAKKSHAGMKSSLDDISEVFGKRGKFKETLELVKGGGAFFGFSLAGNELAEMTEKAKEFQAQLKSGEKSVGQIGEEFAKALPLIGGFVTAGRNIRDMLTGDSAYVAEINEQAKLTALHVENVKTLLKESKAIIDAIRSETTVIEFKIATKEIDKAIGEPVSGTAKRKLQLDLDIGKSGTAFEAQIKTMSEEAAVRMKPLMEEWKKAQKLPEQTTRIWVEKAGTAGQITGDFEEVANPAYAEAVQKLEAAQKAVLQMQTAIADEAAKARGARTELINAQVKGLIGDANLTKKTLDAVFGAVVTDQNGTKIVDGWLQKFQAIAKGGEAILGPMFGPIIRKFETDLTRVGPVADSLKFLKNVANIPAQLAEQATMNTSLTSLKIDELKTMAMYSGQNLDLEARKLEIGQKYIDQTRELNRIKGDVNSTAEQKAEADRLLSTIERRKALEQQEAALDLVRATVHSQIPSVKTGIAEIYRIAATEQYVGEQNFVDRSANAVTPSSSQANSKDSDRPVVKAIENLGKLLVDKLGGIGIPTYGRTGSTSR